MIGSLTFCLFAHPLKTAKNATSAKFLICTRLISRAQYMWFNKNKKYIGVVIFLILFIFSLISWGPSIAEGISIRNASTACDISKTNESEKLDCWLQIVFEHLRDGGIAEAFRVFDHLYETYPIFGASGCHQHAHKVGDTAYYELFIARGVLLEDMNFPQSATSCGYGFFHGFIEHLIQDHPETEYVKKTCEYLRGRHSNTMGDIATICYHASGHGFIQGEADTLQKKDWGNYYKIVSSPLLRCEGLPDVTEREMEDCREGVFNVVVDWMISKDFGLSYDYNRPFVRCDELKYSWQYPCYYEFGMKLEPVIGDEPLNAEVFVRSIPDKILREMSFGVMIAGMMQRQAPLNTYQDVIDGCVKVSDSKLFKVCIRSSVNGMMEHGSPGKEYIKILPICKEASLMKREGTKICYETLARRLSRFYPPEKKDEICGEFPDAYRSFCNTTP